MFDIKGYLVKTFNYYFKYATPYQFYKTDEFLMAEIEMPGLSENIIEKYKNKDKDKSWNPE